MSAQPYYHYVLADKYSELGSYLLSVDTEHRVHWCRSGPGARHPHVSPGPAGAAGGQTGASLGLHHGPRPGQLSRVMCYTADYITQPLVLAWCAVNRVTLETGRTNHPELCLSPYTAMRGGRGCAVLPSPCLLIVQV